MAPPPFHGVYLLQSRSSPGSKRTYIGFTVDPRRRLRQHNGELASGAWKTHRHRPWDMLLVVHGFPTRSQALAFEWAWQHPAKSRAARAAVAGLPQSALAGPDGRVRTLIEMLHLPPWRAFPLEVAVTSSAHEGVVAAAVAAAGRPPPPHVRVGVMPLDVLAAGYVTGGGADDDESDGAPSESDAEGAPSPAASPSPATTIPSCAICGQPMPDACLPCASPACGAACHVDCLADHYLSIDASGGVLPTSGACPACHTPDTWLAALARQTRGAPSAWAAAWKRTAARGKVRRRKVPKAPASVPASPAVKVRASVGKATSASAPASPAVAKVAARGGGARAPPPPADVDEIIILSSDDDEEEAGDTVAPASIRGGALPHALPSPRPPVVRPPAVAAWRPPPPPPPAAVSAARWVPPRPPPRLPGRLRGLGAAVCAARVLF